MIGVCVRVPVACAKGCVSCGRATFKLCGRCCRGASKSIKKVGKKGRKGSKKGRKVKKKNKEQPDADDDWGMESLFGEEEESSEDDEGGGGGWFGFGESAGSLPPLMLKMDRESAPDLNRCAQCGEAVAGVNKPVGAW